MTSFSNLRARLVGTVFLAIAPAWVLMYYTNLPWIGFAVGLLALAAAWFGGERFILRQVRILLSATERLASGDLKCRTGLDKEYGELGELARKIDKLAENIEIRVKDREKVEQMLLNRSFQQTVVSSLGQFALKSGDFNALLNQAVMFVSQTLEVEYCHLLEVRPGSATLFLSAGTGWKPGLVGNLEIANDPATHAGYCLGVGDPVIVKNLKLERRFKPGSFLMDHGVVSGVTVPVQGTGRSFGILGAHTTNQRSFTGDEVQFLLAVATVLAMAVERQQAEAQLRKLASFTQLNPNPSMELTSTGEVSYSNEAARELANSIGVETPQTLLPSNASELVEECLAKNRSRACETKLSGRTISWSFHPVAASHVVHAYGEDITDRLNLEEQLRQSQKMESVGQLAAGVAHDFNNMLTVIQGHTGMLLSRPSLAADQRESAQAIGFAAERAANLTRQLLMFSRKNIMQPTLLDLREVIGNTGKLLQRLLGETIHMEFVRPPELPLVNADTGMVEQVLMNLAVNARDAMPRGGQVVIGVRTVTVDEEYTHTHAEARSGRFVCLFVRDTGCGMTPEVAQRIFEPFFTTKEVGKGTGLGLATVYGIVKQHAGWIEVDSVLNQGTEFEIYFPACEQLARAAGPAADSSHSVTGGKETILVVEDEPALRDLAHAILANCGYQVLQASSGPEALRVWQEHQDNIDLVLTDMVMPEGMSGRDLAQRLHSLKPGVKVVFASGYSVEEMETELVTQGGSVYLQKPYTHVTLAKAVRDCLDQGAHNSTIHRSCG